jgi:hypothetical protein
VPDLPPLATVQDLADWVGEDIEADNPQALAFLRAASAKVRSFTGRTWAGPDGELEPVPGDVHTVVVQVASRVWRNPDGYVQDTTGPFTVRWTERVADGIYLTSAEEDMLEPHRRGRPALWALGTTRGPVETGTVRVPRGASPLLAREDW